MNTTKLLTVLVAALVVSAGAGAVTAGTATQTSADTNVDASYDDGAVTLTVTQNGTAVENVTVEANGETVGTTDANGTLTFETNATDELEMEFDGENVDLERTYAVEDAELVLADDEDEDESELAADVSYDNGTVDVTVTQNGSAVENATVATNGETVGTTDANGTLAFETNATEELELEISSGEQELEQEYVLEDGELVREEDDDEDEEVELSADVSYDNGTVDVTVTRNGSAVENATVAANGEDVGTTGANGTLTFETNATEELEIEITAGEGELELEYEDGELVEESDEDDEAGPSENASDRAKGVFGAIQTWLDGGQEGSLGQLIQETLGNGNDDAPGNSGDAPGNGNADEAPGQDDDDDEADDEDESPGNSDEAPGKNKDKGNDKGDQKGDDAGEDETEDGAEDDEIGRAHV